MACKYGKLKHPTKGRRCKKRRVTSRRTKRRSRRSSRGVKVLGMSLGTLAIAGIGAVGAYKFWESRGA